MQQKMPSTPLLPSATHQLYHAAYTHQTLTIFCCVKTTVHFRESTTFNQTANDELL